MLVEVSLGEGGWGGWVEGVGVYTQGSMASRGIHSVLVIALVNG